MSNRQPGETDYSLANQNAAERRAMADTITRLNAEVERLKGFEELYKAGCAAWNPVFKVVLDERDALRVRVAELEGALAILGDHWKHGYGGPTRADVIRAVEGIARAVLSASQEAPAHE